MVKQISESDKPKELGKVPSTISSLNDSDATERKLSQEILAMPSDECYEKNSKIPTEN